MSKKSGGAISKVTPKNKIITTKNMEMKMN